MTPESAAALRRPFDPKTIGKLPKGGTQLDFVGHAAVTDRLLAIDPLWSWEPFATDEQGLPAYQNGYLWIRLTVCGVTRIGVGDGPDPKQRIGDAIRNAAMRFGVALDLWSRQELESIDPNGGDAGPSSVNVAAHNEAQQQARATHEAAQSPEEQEATENRWFQSFREHLIAGPESKKTTDILQFYAKATVAAAAHKVLDEPVRDEGGMLVTVRELIEQQQLSRGIAA